MITETDATAYASRLSSYRSVSIDTVGTVAGIDARLAHAPCPRCGRAVEAGASGVVYEVRRKGKSSDDYLCVHAECVVEALAPAPQATEVSVTEARRAYRPAPRAHASRGGHACRHCGGPCSDGSGDCGECR